MSGYNRKINKTRSKITGSYTVTKRKEQIKLERMYKTYVKYYEKQKELVKKYTGSETYIPKMYSLKEYNAEIKHQKDIYAIKGIESRNYGRDIAVRQLSDELGTYADYIKRVKGDPLDRGWNIVKSYKTKQQKIINDYIKQGMSPYMARKKYLTEYDYWISEDDVRYHTSHYYEVLNNLSFIEAGKAVGMPELTGNTPD